MKIVQLFSAKEGISGLPRPIVEKLNLIVGYGIENDKFAGKNLNRSVMIIGINSYELAKRNGIDLEFGSFGENILLESDPHDLEIGDRLEIGDAIIEITGKCSLCNHLQCFGSELPKVVKDKRGLYCKIIKSGIVIPIPIN